MSGRVYIQSGWVVRDLMASVRSWLTAGVGPFFVIPKVEVTGFYYRGASVGMNIGVAIAQAGGIQIELIQPNDASPSPYRDVFGSDGQGFHHFATLVTDMDRALADRCRQAPLVARGTSGDMRFAYVDTRETIGCMTELMQMGPEVEVLFAHIAESSRDWDGSEPVRYLG